MKSIFNRGCFENTNLLAMFSIRQMEDGHPVCEAKDFHSRCVCHAFLSATLGFRGYCKIVAQAEEKPDPNRTKQEKSKIPLDIKTKKPLVFFYENQKLDAKNLKICKLQ